MWALKSSEVLFSLCFKKITFSEGYSLCSSAEDKKLLNSWVKNIGDRKFYEIFSSLFKMIELFRKGPIYLDYHKHSNF